VRGEREIKIEGGEVIVAMPCWPWIFFPRPYVGRSGVGAWSSMGRQWARFQPPRESLHPPPGGVAQWGRGREGADPLRVVGLAPSADLIAVL